MLCLTVPSSVLAVIASKSQLAGAKRPSAFTGGAYVFVGHDKHVDARETDEALGSRQEAQINRKIEGFTTRSAIVSVFDGRLLFLESVIGDFLPLAFIELRTIF